ncbi:MAG: hypothetical protein QF464_21300, partial [Myxococcota bacterium]|nr:hypothetical protein [Myxococcota bacterium]
MGRETGTWLGLWTLTVMLALAGCGGATDTGEPEPDTASADTSADGAATTTVDDAGDDASTVDDATPPQAEAGPPEEDVSPPPRATDPCDPTSPLQTRAIVLPLGETLHLSGDDYLAFWSPALTCEATIDATPEGAEAGLVTDASGAQRWTPDVAGTWTLTRGRDTLLVEVDDAYLTPDTFVNYNYSPVTPIAQTADGALWVASPVSNAVQRVDVAGDAPVAEILVPTGSWPTSLETWVDPSGVEWLLVSQTGRDSLGFVDVAAG